MNNCLADLSKLIPSYYMKKSRGRIEKTEIIEMAIKYLKHLQAHACSQIGEDFRVFQESLNLLYDRQRLEALVRLGQVLIVAYSSSLMWIRLG